jgi:glycosyltransferase involved in cell wall biosynthesis
LSCHVLAAQLHSATGVPWIADYRDLHTDDPYLELPPLRRVVDRLIEQRTIRSASALTAVSEGFCTELKRIHGRDEGVFCVRNSVSAEVLSAVSCGPDDCSSAGVSLMYAGTLYDGRRDPGPLFAAVEDWNARARHVEATLDLYGPDLSWLEARYGLAAQSAVRVHEAIPRDAVLALQSTVTANVVFLHDSDYDRHVMTGKIYELMAGGRPILAVGGPDQSEARDVIESGPFGLYVPGAAVNTQDIASLLRLSEEWDCRHARYEFNRRFSPELRVREFADICEGVTNSAR